MAPPTLLPSRREALLLGVAAAGCSPGGTEPTGDLPATDARDEASADARATDAQELQRVDAAIDDLPTPRDAPRDMPAADRGPPCALDPPWVPSLPLDEVPDRGAAVDYDRYMVIARDEGGVYAYTAICTHQRCVIYVEEGGTRCPCHDSTFDVDGRRTGGPASRALTNHPVRVCGGRVWVDPSHAVPAGTRTEA